MTVTVWHNTRCSKSRGALQLIADKGIEAQVRLYLEDPPSRHELEEVVARLGGDPRALLRTGEPESRGLRGATDEEVLDALAAHPRLIERPVVLTDDRAVVARPPERALEIL